MKLRRTAMWVLLLAAASAVGRASALTAIWANDGGDKVARSEIRASLGGVVTNRLWDGSTIRLMCARNEVLGFALVLESASGVASNISVQFPRLGGPGGPRFFPMIGRFQRRFSNHWKNGPAAGAVVREVLK